MAGVTSTTIGNALKDLWEDGVEVEIYKETPLLGLMNKNPDFDGKSLYIDVIYGTNRARSASYSNARSNGSAGKNKAFNITRKSNYAFGTIDRQTMLAAKRGNKDALFDALATECEGMIAAFKQDMSADAYSDGSGVRGRIDSSVTLASTSLLLRDPTTVIHFEVDDILVLSPNADGTSVRTGTLTVTAVNRDTGTLTLSGNISTGVSAATVNDYIYKQGDAATKPVGVGGWVPASAPSNGESFFGVDRSVDGTRLAGLRYDGSTYNHEEALIKGLQAAAKQMSFPSSAFLNPDDFGALELLLGSKKMYEDVEGPAGIGYSSLVINGPKGKVRVYSDPWAPKSTAFVLSLDTWTCHSLGTVPHWVDDDGEMLSRQYASGDGFEFYLAGYYQFGCNRPGQNMRITLPTV